MVPARIELAISALSAQRLTTRPRNQKKREGRKQDGPETAPSLKMKTI